MRSVDLLSPITDEAPCGPDLDATGDGDYFNYTISADERFPPAVVNAITGVLYDRKSIKLADEERQTDSLLKRTRDLRLLVLAAQFQITSGEIAKFADTLEAIVALMRAFWHDVHPTAEDGDLTLRRVALEGLDDHKRVVLPLNYAPLFEDRRIGAISLRSWQVSQKPEIAKSSDQLLGADQVRDAIAAPANSDAVLACYANVQKASRCLADIRGKFLSEEQFDYAPVFDGTMSILSDVASMLAKNLPQLDARESAEESAEADRLAPGLDEAGLSEQPVRTSTAGDLAGVYRTTREVKDALAGLEAYFVVHEPSSPALLLVCQARRLVGRPLVEALAALAPKHTRSAVLKIDESAGFELDLVRMQELTAGVLRDEETGIAIGTPVPQREIVDRNDAFSVMRGIENFLSVREPSSPVPILLARGRELMARNFSSILKDLLGRQVTSGSDGSDT